MKKEVANILIEETVKVLFGEKIEISIFNDLVLETILLGRNKNERNLLSAMSSMWKYL